MIRHLPTPILRRIGEAIDWATDRLLDALMQIDIELENRGEKPVVDIQIPPPRRADNQPSIADLLRLQGACERVGVNCHGSQVRN
jgi:hypothetical protein